MGRQLLQAAAARAPFPERIGRYEILLPIGTGGLATVYLARARGVGGFEREVALKLVHAHLRTQGSWAVELVEEAKVAARIRHPNVVPVLDVGDDPFGIFLVLEYIEGDTLSALARAVAATERPLPAPVALRILVDALAGLHAAHELCDDSGDLLGLVHRDFSPQNILVGVDGTSRLTDFGIAKTTARIGFTREGLVKGKLGYMSPEQARAHPLDRRCDVWAAGVVAWQLFAGRRLYPVEDEVATLLQIVTGEAPRLRTVRPDLPASLDDTIASALTTDVKARCSSADELRRRLVEASRDLGGIADASAVAELVSEVLGQSLKDRKARVREVASLRTKVGEIVATSTQPDGASTSPPALEHGAFADDQPETTTVNAPVAAGPSGEWFAAADATDIVNGKDAATARPRAGKARQLAFLSLAVLGTFAATAAGLQASGRLRSGDAPESSAPAPPSSPSASSRPLAAPASAIAAEPIDSPAPAPSASPAAKQVAAVAPPPARLPAVERQPAASAQRQPPARPLPKSPYE